MDKIYDVIILSAGPNGLTAGIYAGRTRLDTLLIEKGKDGGQIAVTDEIEDYPGQIVDSESGPPLIERMTKQIEELDAERVCDTIVSVDIEGPVRTLVSSDGAYKARTLTIATGAFPGPAGYKGEDGFIDKGVFYYTTCDASFFEDLEVFVVDDGDSATGEAMHLTKFTRKVTVIHRRDELRAARFIQKHAFKNPKLFFMWDTVVEELHGDGILSGMTVKNVKTGELARTDANEDDDLLGVFGFIGYNPKSELFEGKLEMDREYIETDEDTRTNMEGVYAVGDIRIRSLRQVVTTAAGGATVSMQARKWLTEQR